jgi:hypothetical protein
MSDDHPTGETMTIEEASISHIGRSPQLWKCPNDLWSRRESCE